MYGSRCDYSLVSTLYVGAFSRIRLGEATVVHYTKYSPYLAYHQSYVPVVSCRRAAIITNLVAWSTAAWLQHAAFWAQHTRFCLGRRLGRNWAASTLITQVFFE